MHAETPLYADPIPRAHAVLQCWGTLFCIVHNNRILEKEKREERERVSMRGHGKVNS
jgi:hypothetical protein